MPAQTEKSQLKRGRVRLEPQDMSFLEETSMLTGQLMQPSQGEQVEPKKARTSRLSPIPHSRLKQGPLPSPVTHKESTASDDYKEGTVYI